MKRRERRETGGLRTANKRCKETQRGRQWSGIKIRDIKKPGGEEEQRGRGGVKGTNLRRKDAADVKISSGGQA